VIQRLEIIKKETAEVQSTAHALHQNQFLDQGPDHASLAVIGDHILDPDQDPVLIGDVHVLGIDTAGMEEVVLVIIADQGLDHDQGAMEGDILQEEDIAGLPCLQENDILAIG